MNQIIENGEKFVFVYSHCVCILIKLGVSLSSGFAGCSKSLQTGLKNIVLGVRFLFENDTNKITSL